MNGNFYQNPTFPTNTIEQPRFESPSNNPDSISNNSTEQIYIENILNLNKGRKVNIYVSFPNSTNWHDKMFTGLIEKTGKDYLIIKDVTNGIWYLIRITYIDYIEFMEPINYLI